MVIHQRPDNEPPKKRNLHFRTDINSALERVHLQQEDLGMTLTSSDSPPPQLRLAKGVRGESQHLRLVASGLAQVDSILAASRPKTCLAITLSGSPPFQRSV